MPDTLKTILFKKEVTEGTDAAPTPAANAVLTRNFTSKPVEVDTIERPLDLPSRGRRKTGNSNRRTRFGYELELAGSGAAGTAPAWMEHLEACGMAAPTVTATVKAEQKFAGAGGALSSATCHHFTGGERVRALGARGKWSLDLTAGRYPFLKLDFIGMLPPAPAAAVDATAVGGVPDYTRWKDPLEVNNENTDFTLDGYALLLQSLTLDDNADIKARNLVGARYAHRGDYALTGRIRGDAPTLASKNFYASLDTGAEVPLQLVHGIVAGSIVQLDAPYVQILGIERVEEDDKLQLDITIGLNIRAGQDDLLITAK